MFYGKPQRQEVHEHLSLSFLRQKVPYAMEMLFAENKLYELCNLSNENIRGLSVEDEYGEIRHFQ